MSIINNIQNLGQNLVTQPLDLNSRLYQASLPYSGLPNSELIRYTATNFNLYNMPNHSVQPSVAVKEKILQLASATTKTFSNYLDFSKLEIQDLVLIEKILTSFNQSYEIVNTPYNQTIGMLLPTIREYISYKNSQGSFSQTPNHALTTSSTNDKYAYLLNYSNEEFLKDFKLTITNAEKIANSYRLAKLSQDTIIKAEDHTKKLQNQYARIESFFDQNYQLKPEYNNENSREILLVFKDYIKSGSALKA